MDEQIKTAVRSRAEARRKGKGTAEPLILRALAGEPVERTPIWLMRQAGRYLPEYRAIRQEHDFLEMCRSPELAAEVTLQPIRRFGVDAAIIFSDILLVLDAMGVEVGFDSSGPVIGNPVRTSADARRLTDVDPYRDLPYVAEAIRATIAELPPEVPLIGFAGSPFTLLTYVMGGRGDRARTSARALLLREPALARELLRRIASAVAAQLEAQIAAGAGAVQLFDTWGGSLPLQLWRRFAAPAARQVFTALRHLPVPKIYFMKGTESYLEHLDETGASAFGIDWQCDFELARAKLGAGVTIQGNLDPAFLLTTAGQVEDQAKRLLEVAGPRSHVFNLGHGVLPETDPAMVEALVRKVKESAAEDWRRTSTSVGGTEPQVA